MRYALVSDIHANLQAWEAVQADIRQTGVDAIVCLGDVVGYGPRPREVLDAVRAGAGTVLLGNHEAALCGRFDADCFSDEARRLIEWTAAQLSADDVQYFAGLAAAGQVDTFAVAHSGFVEPEAFDYVTDVAEAATQLNAVAGGLAFLGHTHIPGCFALPAGADRAVFTRAIDCVAGPAAKLLVNVGSVGELRTGEVAASYCLYDTATGAVVGRRVAFDVEGYRADLRRCGIGRKPYFLQCLDGEAAAEQPAAQRALRWSEQRRDARREEVRRALATRQAQARLEAEAQQARLAANREKLKAAQDSAVEARLARDARLAAAAEARRTRLRALQAEAATKRRADEARAQAASRIRRRPGQPQPRP